MGGISAGYEKFDQGEGISNSPQESTLPPKE